ncbi:type I inositol polyphosphate 5-phosphatase 8 [Olea europaea var. sylvestris]|uniref:type I inositol polyphosphate 5-phosphatase 8 n=1 Tax=Olea europaea var. sylvestris TaxID=158386 RepID=UPI000C1CE7C4|nr:type I inositol polyphosphate 5-phosphatase 8 [Olea europaea var. sylvestris]
MRTDEKISKASWPKVVARKWLNMNSGAEEYHSDYRTKAFSYMSERRKSCSDEARSVVVPEELSVDWLMGASNKINRPGFDLQSAPSPINNSVDHILRMFLGTWNVGGKPPHDGLNMEDWLGTTTKADIYVLGFQEIVPLNAGNVLGPEDCAPAAKWLSLIRQALNGEPNNSSHSNTVSSMLKQSPGSNDQQQMTPNSRVSFSDLMSLEDELDHDVFERFLSLRSSSYSSEEGSSSPPSEPATPGMVQNQYRLVASKQMVGIFQCVWVREDLCQQISSLKVSCVGRGIMGYLGNKGSISISMTLYQTTICFVCTHLTSGEKKGDEIRRNLDVMEILKRTRFSHPCRIPGKPTPPDNILDHDKVFWIGDLNYRLASVCDETYELLKIKDWQALLEKDQLRIEQKAGRIFDGWKEGKIEFAPTYKYVANSDNYVAQTSASKAKRRTPAWCDRILWKGEGLKQMCYVRGESKFSDHRPVYSLFTVQADNVTKKEKPTSIIGSNTPEPSTADKLFSETAVLSATEKFMFITRAQSCRQKTSRFSLTARQVTSQ